jgi:hypothetical protein
VGLGLGLPENNPPTGLLTKTQPNPRVGFSWAGLGGGRVLARPTCGDCTQSAKIHVYCKVINYSIIPI